MTDILFPVGRLVMGNLYKPQETDAMGQPLVIKTGPKVGQPRVDYFFAVAIPKGVEKQWQQTNWGMIIVETAKAGFPAGQHTASTFAWKITDGDSQLPNSVGRKPCDREGHPGHWVLHFSGGYAPKIYNADGSQILTEVGAVKLGYYVEVYGSVVANGNMQKPGVYLNHSLVALSAYGEEITVGPDAKGVGFGATAAPAGASKTPVAAFSPPPSAAFLAVPPPVARVMLPPSKGATYEQMIAAGWTDALLVQHGMMSA